MFLQLPQLGDAVFQLPFPIVPKFRRNPAIARPIAWRVEAERLFLLNSLGEIDHFRICVEKTLTSLTIVSTHTVLTACLSMDLSDDGHTRLFNFGVYAGGGNFTSQRAEV